MGIAASVKWVTTVGACLALAGPAVARDPSVPDVALAAGRQVYAKNCLSCHQTDGSGVPGTFPPLAQSDYLLQDPQRAIGFVLHGNAGPVTVNGEDYYSAMPPQDLTDEEVAQVLTYILNAWDNKGGVVTAQQVAKVRARGGGGDQSSPSSHSGMMGGMGGMMDR